MMLDNHSMEELYAVADNSSAFGLKWAYAQLLSSATPKS